MNPHTYLEHGLRILGTNLRNASASQPADSQAGIRPFITISREVCAGATTLGQLLLPLLDQALGQEGQHWVFLDKNLLSRALSHHQLPEELERYLPEDQISEIQSAFGEFVGLHPSLKELERQVAKAIYQLAHLGRVIFTGRGAHLITKALPGGFHLRLVAPEKVRIARMMIVRNCDEANAREFVEKTDAARRRYLKAYFGRDIDDPHLYDIVINSDRLALPAAARMVVEGLRQKLEILSIRTLQSADFESRSFGSLRR